ncbi:MAG: amidohydrolase family protein [Ilumatobacteraceae bacterium]
MTLAPSVATELLVRGTVVTMDAGGTIADGAVAVAGHEIAGVGTYADLRRRHPNATVVGDATTVVTPGYVNAHQHLTGDRLIASCIPDDIDGQAAIFDWAVPVHGAHSADDDELSATLAAVAAVTNGITTTVEAGTVAHPDRVAAAARHVGMRLMLGRWGWDVGDGPLAAPAGEVLARAADLLDRYPSGTGDLVEGWVTLVGHDLMTDELVTGAAELAGNRGTHLTFHMSPHAGDARACLARTGQRPFVHLDALGVLGPHVLVAHAVHVDDAEVDAIARTGTAVAACPWAYLRLAQGVTAAGRYHDLWRVGARLAVGCDAENAGDAVDVLRAATLLAGLIRDRTGDPASFTATDALALATSVGAAAIGKGGVLGVLAPGRRADLVVHDTGGVQWLPPSSDPVRQLVWASDGRSVRDVVVDGRVVVRDGRCTTVDLDALRAAALDRRDHLLRAAGHG